MEYAELMSDVFELERKLFLKMDSYHLVEQNSYKKSLDPDEKKQLYIDIQYVFTRLIRILNNSCPGLTEEDILFCCLKKSRLKDNFVGCCLGGISKQAVNQRKYRIKKKMREAECDYLFDLIFVSEK